MCCCMCSLWFPENGIMGANFHGRKAFVQKLLVLDINLLTTRQFCLRLVILPGGFEMHRPTTVGFCTLRRQPVTMCLITQQDG